MDTASSTIYANVKQAFDDACRTFTHTSSQQSIWVGCSGGLDSVVLLHLANRWAASKDRSVGVIHVNHQLSPNAMQWQQHVEGLAQDYGNECISVSVDVNKASRQSLEAQARDARYQAFASQLPQDAILLLAHHLDDQVETLMLRLFRGSGPQGLGAMEPSTHRAIGERSLHIARPLLNVTRTELDTYARVNGLAWVEDESNLDLSFDRNKVRHKLLPVIQQQWPERYSGIMSAISRSSELCREQQQALALLLDDKLHGMLVEETIVDCQLLRQAEANLQPLLLRHWLGKLGAQMPSHAVLQQLLLAVAADQQSQPEVYWHKHQVRGYQQRLYFLKQPYAIPAYEQKSNNTMLHWIDATGEPVTLSVNTDDNNQPRLTVKSDKSLQLVELPIRQQSYRLALVDGQQYYTSQAHQKARQLKHWFKDWQIPVWHRQAVLGVFADKELLAVTDGQRCWLNAAGAKER